MILLAGLGYPYLRLLSNEFVRPVGRIVERFGDEWIFRHFTDISDDQTGDYDAIIVCGTALKDTRYLGEIERFSWLRGAQTPVLGIGAGMQVLSLAFGGSLLPCCEIGMEEVRVLSPHPILPSSPSFMAYELHAYSTVPPKDWDSLAASVNCIQAISHPDLPLFGILFHPEVRNEGVIFGFLTIVHSEGK